MKSINESSYEEPKEKRDFWLRFCMSCFVFTVLSKSFNIDHISRVVADLEPLLTAELEKMEQIESEAGGLPVPCEIEVREKERKKQRKKERKKEKKRTSLICFTYCRVLLVVVVLLLLDTMTRVVLLLESLPTSTVLLRQDHRTHVPVLVREKKPKI